MTAQRHVLKLALALALVLRVVMEAVLRDILRSRLHHNKNTVAVVGLLAKLVGLLAAPPPLAWGRLPPEETPVFLTSSSTRARSLRNTSLDTRESLPNRVPSM